jgi:porin
MAYPADRSAFMRKVLTAVAVACVLSASAFGARADEPDLWKREKLSGDWGGARTALANKGVEVGINYIGETFNILSGGLKRGTTYEGLLAVQVDTNLDKLLGWTGATTHVEVFQIHNANNRNAADLAGSLADPSNIDALRATRLYTAWFQQDFARFGSVRIGQFAADEFYASTVALGLVNGTFGWPTVMSANLPSGGPTYPLATPGARLQVNPSERVSLLAAVFSGDPAGRNCTTSPQECNRHGTTFSLAGGAFWIGEAQYQVNQGKDATGLAAAYKLGVWYHTGRFPDQHFGIVPATGAILTLAATPTPDPFHHRGNWGVYGVVDQMLWRGAQSSVSVFARAGAAPSDRNLVSWYVDGGIGVKGPLPGRADDTLTFGVAHSQISGDAAALDRDTLALNGPPYPIRNGETVFELSYILHVARWWLVQPDIQYILRPGGNVPDPNVPTRTVGDALVFGARSIVTF